MLNPKLGDYVCRFLSSFTLSIAHLPKLRDYEDICIMSSLTTNRDDAEI
jgi:hypothetical protein